LQLLTFGLENCDNELVDRCRDWNWGGAEAKFPDTDLQAALKRMGFPHVHLVLDARGFPDFQSAQLTRHLGVHPEIIARITGHKRFPRWLQDVKRQWKEISARAEREGEQELVVALYCRMGKHRSVAATECLRYIAETVEGILVEPVLHLSKPRWGKNVCRGGCDECSPFSEERDAALERAAQLWRDAR